MLPGMLPSIYSDSLPPVTPQNATTNATRAHAWLLFCLLARCPCILPPQMPPKLADILDHTPSLMIG